MWNGFIANLRWLSEPTPVSIARTGFGAKLAHVTGRLYLDNSRPSRSAVLRLQLSVSQAHSMGFLSLVFNEVSVDHDHVFKMGALLVFATRLFIKAFSLGSFGLARRSSQLFLRPRQVHIRHRCVVCADSRARARQRWSLEAVVY